MKCKICKGFKKVYSSRRDETVVCEACDGTGTYEEFEHIGKAAARGLENLERPSSQLGRVE